MKAGGQYRKGANKERWLVKHLLSRGAVVAFRSAGSHSPIDVVAEFPTYRYLAQCKSGVRPPKEEYDTVRILSGKMCNAVVALCWFPDRCNPVVKEYRELQEVVVQGGK